MNQIHLSPIGHRVVGEGPEKVLVFHGWMGDSTVFEPILPFLNQQAFTYVFMDYRGYGLSKTLKGEYTMKEIGEDAIGLVDHLGWESFHLIGHSMGGMAIQWIASQVKERVKSLVGITPVPANGFPFDSATEGLFRGAKGSPENRGMILSHTTGNRLSPVFSHVMTQRSLVQTTADAFDGYLTAWSQTDFSQSVMGLATPFQILLGQYDPAVTKGLMEQTLIKWFTHTQLTMIENAGHYPMVESPVYLVTLWENFLQEMVQKRSEGSAVLTH